MLAPASLYGSIGHYKS